MPGLLHTTSALCDSVFVLVSLQLSHYCICRRHACYPLKGIWLDLRGNGASVTEANLNNGGPVYVWRGHAENYQCPPYTWDRNEIRIESIKAQVWDRSDYSDVWDTFSQYGYWHLLQQLRQCFRLRLEKRSQDHFPFTHICTVIPDMQTFRRVYRQEFTDIKAKLTLTLFNFCFSTQIFLHSLLYYVSCFNIWKQKIIFVRFAFVLPASSQKI